MNKTNIKYLVVLLVIVVGLVFLTNYLLERGEEKKLLESVAAGALVGEEGKSDYADIEGNPVDLADYIGGTIVVTSWASWCPFCSDQLRQLSDYLNENPDSEVYVLAINRAEPITTAQSFLKTINAHENIVLLLDPKDKYYKSIGGFTMPETVFYDRKGSIVHHQRGVLKSLGIEKYIEEANKTESDK